MEANEQKGHRIKKRTMPESINITTPLPSKNGTGLSGEYFVAAELYRRGFSVGMTIGNAKSIDILAEKDGKVIQIQVKAIFRKQSVGWNMNDHSLLDHILYVLVNLNSWEQPDYYILTAKEIRKYHKQYVGRGILDLSKAKKLNCLDRWDKLEPNKKK